MVLEVEKLRQRRRQIDNSNANNIAVMGGIVSGISNCNHREIGMRSVNEISSICKENWSDSRKKEKRDFVVILTLLCR